MDIIVQGISIILVILPVYLKDNIIVQLKERLGNCVD